LYGGFSGIEVRPDQRDWEKYETILDGREINYHVVTGADNAIIDGFTIRRGEVNLINNTDRYYDSGGGMYNDTANPTVANCRFVDNHAKNGGAMCNISSSPILVNCMFRHNTVGTSSGSSGGAIYNRESSSPVLTNCVFIKNSVVLVTGFNGGALGYGGAIRNILSSSVNTPFFEQL